MAERLSGKVALVTGAARGQGRSHAVRLAQEGADVIAIDICAGFKTVHAAPPATPEDLEQTTDAVRGLGRRCLAEQVDVRYGEALEATLQRAVAELGRLDIVVANAGIYQPTPTLELTDEAWRETIDVNLTGVWNTAKAALPHILAGGRGGSIVLTSSLGGLKGLGKAIHYVAAKHGVVGIMRALANEYGKDMIRVNSVHPTGVNTPMIQNEEVMSMASSTIAAAEAGTGAISGTNVLPIPWVEPVDVSNAVVFLASDEARYITGVTLPVDAGALGK